VKCDDVSEAESQNDDEVDSSDNTSDKPVWVSKRTYYVSWWSRKVTSVSL